jgi:hypothetical protein
MVIESELQNCLKFLGSCLNLNFLNVHQIGSKVRKNKGTFDRTLRTTLCIQK